MFTQKMLLDTYWLTRHMHICLFLSPLLIHWRLQKFKYSSYTMSYAAGWSSNLQGDCMHVGKGEMT